MNFRFICTVALVFTAGLFLGKSVSSQNNKPKSSSLSDPHEYSYIGSDATLPGTPSTASSTFDSTTAVNSLKQQLSKELSSMVASILDQAQLKTQQQHMQNEPQQQQATVSNTPSLVNAQSAVREQQIVNAATHLLHQLGLSESSAGLHFHYATAERDASLPLCFTHAFAKSLEALCPNVFHGSVARPCSGGMGGWTCGRSSSATGTDMGIKRTEEESGTRNRQQLGCSNEFAPVCCRVGQNVHAMENYCTCRRLGGQFVSPGSSCSSVRPRY